MRNPWVAGRSGPEAPLPIAPEWGVKIRVPHSQGLQRFIAIENSMKNKNKSIIKKDGKKCDYGYQYTPGPRNTDPNPCLPPLITQNEAKGVAERMR